MNANATFLFQETTTLLLNTSSTAFFTCSLIFQGSFWKIEGRETKAKMNGNSKWLKGPPVVLQLSVVREGHAGSVWRREAERGRAGGGGGADTQSERRAMTKRNSSFHLPATCFRPPHLWETAVLYSVCVCVRGRVTLELWCVSIVATEHLNENMHEWRVPQWHQWVSARLFIFSDVSRPTLSLISTN